MHILTSKDRAVLRISALPADATWDEYYDPAEWDSSRQAQSGIAEARKAGMVERGAYALTDAGTERALWLLEQPEHAQRSLVRR